MGKTFQLGRPELAEEVARQSKEGGSARRMERLTALRLAMSGEHTLEQIGKIVGRARSRSIEWMRVARTEGVESLLGRHQGRGRKAQVTGSAAFLREIAALDTGAVHVVIQDQAGFHLKEGDERLPSNVRLLPLPPYSPELNPVERIGDLIKDASGNRVFVSLEQLEAAIERELRPLWQSPQRGRSLVGDGSLRSQVNAFSN